ncbi:fumarylacetoacetate hydrolase family protein [Nocardioides carbamazepini]|uniref:fumarylacetoacetate hydrolase family protein n=1 Tax=Nocardioides carbamazepini TaxID=2854259 RepID=UPI00214A0C4E|nr:fumarylacetoacetate hydrolase family protein [Nocardioides carbamazepini]MCR1782355.1 fumarylacetoacetate hydrolase family protein [Nocardioides carbamazepini]
MRIGTALLDGTPQVVVVESDGSVTPAAEMAGRPLSSVLDVIDDPGLAALLEERSPAGAAQPEAGVEWLAPLRPRRNLFCVGWNYMPHYEEGHKLRDVELPPVPAHPALFSKTPETVVGPGPRVRYPAHSTELDWEGELAVVIGRGGSDIAEDEALDHVFGYTVANDISVRDFQRRHGNQWFKGKSFDTHCPMGPTIVTRAEVPDPQALEVALDVNGEPKQHASTATMIFPVSRLISELSVGMALLPGDVILTGTPAGVGATQDPPQFLQVGDRVTVSISGIGRLESEILSVDG